MKRIVQISILIVFAVVLIANQTSTADNPVIREFLGRAIKQELSRHDSEATAWYSEKKEKKQQWAETNIFGQEVKTLIAEWTEETKTWVWLDEPNNNLSITFTRFDINNGRVYFGVIGTGKLKFKAWGKIPNLVVADVKGSARPEITVEGSTTLSGTRLAGVRVDRLDGKLHDARFNNDALHAMRGLVMSALNDYIKSNEGDLKRNLEEAINGVSF
jgi:hypothetical protein